MKFRDYKIFTAGEYYHVYNRGNNKEPIFLDEQDYLNFLKRLKIVLGLMSVSPVSESDPRKRVLSLRSLPNGSFAILAYCLMPNHFHFLLKQNTEVGIPQLISKVCTSYAIYFNKKYNRIGHVFQDAFKAKLVDNDSYLSYLSAYIHNNPKDPVTYPYSSFIDYVGQRPGVICNKEIVLSYFNTDVESYKKFVLAFSRSDEFKIRDLLFTE